MVFLDRLAYVVMRLWLQSEANSLNPTEVLRK